MHDEAPILSREIVTREVERAQRRRVVKRRWDLAKRGLAVALVALVPALACAAARHAPLGADGVVLAGLL